MKTYLIVIYHEYCWEVESLNLENTIPIFHVYSTFVFVDIPLTMDINFSTLEMFKTFRTADDTDALTLSSNFDRNSLTKKKHAREQPTTFRRAWAHIWLIAQVWYFGLRCVLLLLEQAWGKYCKVPSSKWGKAMVPGASTITLFAHCSQSSSPLDALQVLCPVYALILQWRGRPMAAGKRVDFRWARARGHFFKAHSAKYTFFLNYENFITNYSK